MAAGAAGIVEEAVVEGEVELDAAGSGMGVGAKDVSTVAAGGCITNGAVEADADVSV